MASEDAAVVVTLRANLKDYEAALKSAVRATERAATAAEKTLSNVGKKVSIGPALNQNFQKSSAQMVNDARVMQYQLNDIFSGLASGQGIRAVQQQLGQIAQQMSGGGLVAGARTLGTAMLGMVNPINLAVVAFGVLATVAASYFSDTEKDAEKATKELEKQADELQKLADKYGQLFPELNRAAEKLRDQADAAGRAVAKEKSLTVAYEDTQKAMAAQSEGITEIVGLLDAMGAPIKDVAGLANAFNDLATAVEEHKASVKDAQPLLKALDAIIENGSGKVVELATAIRTELVASFAELERAAESAGQTIQNSLNFSFPGAGGPLDLGPVTGQNRIDLLNRSLEGAAGAIDAFTERVIQAESGGNANAKNPLSSATGAGQFISSTWLEVFKRNFATEAAGMSDAAILALRTDVEANRRMIRAYATENARDLKDAGQEVTEATLHLAHFLGAGGALKVLQAAPGTKIANIPGMAGAIQSNQSILGGGATREDVLAYASRRAGAATRQKEANTELEDWLRLSKEDLDLKNKQLDIDAQFWESDARRKAQMEEQKLIQEGLTAATKQYGTVTDEMRAKIEAAAHAQAFASVKSAELAEHQKQAADSARLQAQAAQQFSQQVSQMAQSAIGGLINDLRNGVEAGEAFNNMLNRILDSLIQMSLQSLFNPAGGGGILSGLFGAAKSGGIVGKTSFPKQRVSPLAFIGAPSMASGGMISGGGVPIIAHPGEMIIPKNMVGKGGAGVTNNIGSIGVSVNSAPDRVVASTDDGKKLGLMIDRAAQAVIVRESRPGGLLRAVPG
jgi:hypothetical protein